MNKYNCILIFLFLMQGFSLVVCMDVPLTGIDKVFLNACKKGTSLEFSLKQNANKYSVDPVTGCTGMHYACQEGHIGIVKKLLQDFDPEIGQKLIYARDAAGLIPLEYAQKNGHLKVVHLVSSYIFQLIVISDLTYEDFVVVVNNLIARGLNIADPSRDDYVNVLSILYSFATQKSVDKMRFLLSKGACVNVRSAGVDPIFSAVFLDRVSSDERIELISLFLDRGSDINAIDQLGLSLLHAAITLKDLMVVNFLIEKNISLTTKEFSGQTAFHYAVIQEEEGIIKALLNCNVASVICSVAQGGGSPLHLAIINGKTNIVKLIVDKVKELGIDINVVLGSDAHKLLYYAAKHGFSCIVKMLVNAGLNPYTSEKTDIQLPHASYKKNIAVRAAKKNLKNSSRNVPIVDKPVAVSESQSIEPGSDCLEKKVINMHLSNEKKPKKSKKSKKKKNKKNVVVDRASVSLEIADGVESVAEVAHAVEARPDHKNDEKISIPQIVEKESVDVQDSLLMSKDHDLVSVVDTADVPDALSVSELVEPAILNRVSHVVGAHTIFKNKQPKKSTSIINPPRLSLLQERIERPFSYAAAVVKEGVRLAAQSIKFTDEKGRATDLHMPSGLMLSDIATLQGYTQSRHVKQKSENTSDLFHAISPDQKRLVLKYGELFDVREEGKVLCYRAMTTKEAKGKVYNGYTEIFINTEKNEIVHAFFNKNKRHTAIDFS